jgi:hypothetical protein
VGVYVKCDGLGEVAVSSHGQVSTTMRGCTRNAANGQSTKQHTRLDARHFSDCAARSRGPSMAVESSKHHCFKHSTKQALPNTASSAQVLPSTAHRYSSESCPRCQPWLGDTDSYCTRFARQQPILARVHIAVPHSVSCLPPFPPFKHDSSPAQARKYRRHLPRRTRGTG